MGGCKQDVFINIRKPHSGIYDPLMFHGGESARLHVWGTEGHKTGQKKTLSHYKLEVHSFPSIPICGNGKVWFKKSNKAGIRTQHVRCESPLTHRPQRQAKTILLMQIPNTNNVRQDNFRWNWCVHCAISAGNVYVIFKYLLDFLLMSSPNYSLYLTLFFFK